MNQRNDQTMAQQAAGVVDNVADGIRSAAHNVGGSVRSATQSVRDVAGRVAGAVEDTCQQAGDCARETFDRTRARARSLENRLERSVRDNPKTSLVLAAAFGVVLGALWKRR